MDSGTSAIPSASSSSTSLNQELDGLSMNDNTETVSQAAQFAKSVNDILQGPSSVNGNGQPSKRSRVSSDDALVDDEIVVNKRAKPDLSEACAKAYKNLCNTGVRLARYENQRDFLKKYLDLGVTPAYMRYNTVPSIGRNNPVLKNRWDKTIQSMTRKLLQLQHDEAIRIVNETRDASRKEDELSEAKLAIRLCTEKVQKSDKAERLSCLTRDMDKRRTRAERTTASGDNQNNVRGKPKSSFSKAGGSNSCRNQNPQRKGKKQKSTNIISTLMKLIQSYQ